MKKKFSNLSFKFSERLNHFVNAESDKYFSILNRLLSIKTKKPDNFHRQVFNYSILKSFNHLI